jgi:tetratricopeptide (TPR) repeat protein
VKHVAKNATLWYKKTHAAKEGKQILMAETDFSSFGGLLRAFRKRRRLTQQQLANAVGVHRSAIIRWELGDFLPESKAVILELSRHLCLDDQDARRLLEASLTALSPYWSVPLPRNPFFTGREEVLRTLHLQLNNDHQTVAITQSYALHGLGGVGKTQIALEYAYRHALEYSALFWIAAETVETLTFSFLRIAEVLQVPERQEADQQRIIAAVQRWLSTHSQWLLIWDNLEDLDLLPRFLPAVRQGAVLLTTRGQALGTLARGLDLAPMEPEEGMLLVLRRAKVLEPEATYEQLHQLATRMPNEYRAASELVSAMGGLPLALDQAGAYLEETGCNTSDYLQRYQQMRASLLDRRGMLGGEHPHSVTATFLLAGEQVEQRQRAAADLLRACTFLHAEAIPEELFSGGAVHLGPELESLAANPSQFDLVIATLRSLSLVQRHPETHTLSIHRLVQAVLHESMDEQQQAIWLRRMSAALNATFPEVTHEVWGQCERLLPHVLACAAAVPDSAGDRALGRVLQKAASYLYNRAQYDQAEALYQRALHIQEQIPGAEHPDLFDSLNGLAFLYAEQRKYDQAEALYQQALHIQEQTLGTEGPAFASMLHKLASLYGGQGKDEQAEALFQQAIHILEQEPEPDRQRRANSLNGLATLYLKQEKYEQAEPLFLHVLSIWEEALGREHPLLILTLNGLAVVRSEQKKYEQAESLYQRALSISEQVYGPEHPQTGYVLVNQAESCVLQGKYEQAESLYQRALSIFEQAFGSEHPLVAYVLAQQGKCYTQQGKYEQAEPLYRQALVIREQQLGPDHPETAQTLYDLAMFYQKQQKRREALAFAERALKSCQSLGAAHPKTGAAQALYTQLLQEQADGEEKMPAPALDAADPLRGFLDACCELRPLAWCRISDLWHSYEQWTASSNGHLPLPRRAFAAQVEALGCRKDRTRAARIWRGIRLVDKSR